ncbi:DUF4269 domain-containing protein [Tissierella pigra]|uniref:DUF4269 domain-containing protein n=1 Tax=Tissierella pigra TaxID=2607614 RepID=UPI001C0F91D8|nr:DUF4269 domain-containing protein [Tissierella pigra]MBU5426725.1 DUF4269 domain-containing protein [Tissierella pigra]
MINTSKRNWKDISYLKEGNSKQRKTYEILINTQILDVLKNYTPIIVGTIPIDIDVENSDLDIVCKVEDFNMFENILKSNFERYDCFKIINYEYDILVCNFIVNNIEIEIYGSKIDTEKSNGYRHMIIEDRLLNLYGDDFRKEVINLKINGLKTEPSFAKILNLKGNPYDELLKLERYSDMELISKYKKIR